MIDRLEAFGVVLSIDIVLVVSFYITFAAGVFSLAPIGSAAIGAYTAALLTPEIGLVPAVVTAMVFAAAVAAATGPWLLRITGVYLAMATLAFSESVRVLAIGLRDVTGGISGLFGLDVYFTLPHTALLAVAVIVAVWFVLDRTRLGLDARVIREDAELAESVGIGVKGFQWSAFVLSGAVGGLAGAMNGLAFFALSPDEFGFHALLAGIAPIVVGGLSTVFAPVVAGIGLSSLVEYLRAFRDYEPIIYGAAIIVFFLLMPRGVGSRWSWLQLWWRLRRWRPPEESGVNEQVRRGAFDLAREAAESKVVPEAVDPEVPLLEVDDVSKAFEGLLAVRRASLELRSSEVLGIVGPNGAGKTTLINLVTGYHPLDSGTVRINGQDVTGAPPHAIAQLGLRRVFQGSRVVETVGPKQNIAVGEKAPALSVPPGRRERPILVRNLSYGAKRWLEIARAVRAPGSVYVFDEPTTGLPLEGIEEFKLLARTLADKGLGVLLVEHNVALIRSVCDRVVVLDFGVVIAEGHPDEVFAIPEVQAAYLGEDHAAPAV